MGLKNLLQKLRGKKAEERAWIETYKQSPEFKEKVIKKQVKELEKKALIEAGVIKTKQTKAGKKGFLTKRMKIITVKSGIKPAPYAPGKIVYGKINPGHDTSHLDTGSIIPRQPPRRIRWV